MIKKIKDCKEILNNNISAAGTSGLGSSVLSSLEGYSASSSTGGVEFSTDRGAKQGTVIRVNDDAILISSDLGSVNAPRSSSHIRVCSFGH